MLKKREFGFVENEEKLLKKIEDKFLKIADNEEKDIKYTFAIKLKLISRIKNLPNEYLFGVNHIICEDENEFNSEEGGMVNLNKLK